MQGFRARDRQRRSSAPLAMLAPFLSLTLLGLAYGRLEAIVSIITLEVRELTDGVKTTGWYSRSSHFEGSFP